MNIKIKIFLLLTTIAILCSCSKEELANICTSQDIAIENFISTNFPNSTVINNEGSNRVIVQEGFGDIAKQDNSVNITYTGYIFSNGIDKQFAKETTTNVKLSNGEIIKGLEKGIIGMKEGESAYIVFSAKNGYYNQPIGIIPSMSALIYYVTLQKINSK